MSATLAHARDKVMFEASRPYTAGRVTLRGDISKPTGNGPFPAVVLMHGCGGWQPAVRHAMNEYADFLVGKGFAVLSVDSFGPRNRGGGAVCESVPLQVDALDYRTHDAYDALRYLQAQAFVDARSIFLMGQSNGGSVAINVAKGDPPHRKNAANGGYRAVVAYYPWCGSFGTHKVDLAAPLLVFGGGQDSWTPVQECQGVQSAGAELEVVVYPAAAHSFDLEIAPQRYLGNLVGLDKPAAVDSRERMASFFMRQRVNQGLQATR
jgi:dienelactone hydrolase